ncbi:MAG TPA: hypothetical protein PLV25_01990, partial [Opitutales bacterium]|nr:hypothetical protein [Opitutales bacterium]
MNLPKPFSYPVSDAGLPRTLCLAHASGDEAVRGLRAQQVTRMYWMLRAVEVTIELKLGDDLTGIKRLI